MIAKDGTPVPRAAPQWLKFKCVDSRTWSSAASPSRKAAAIGFGALLVGYYEDGKLRYAGKIGTGFDDDMLRTLRGRLDALEQDSSPFDEPVDEDGRPFRRARTGRQAGFTEWTRDHKLRHPRFLGLRDDKAAQDVVREAPDG